MKQFCLNLAEKRYLLPFFLVITLFFLWGFARAILDVLNKHFQTILNVSIFQSALIQVITFLAYFFLAIPSGAYVMKHGYKSGVILGLLLFAIGCLLFVPSSLVGGFYPFLVALFVVACGLVFLEVSANPYVVQLGPSSTSSSRLNFAQSFNGLGSIIAPIMVGQFLFSENNGDVMIPYVLLGVCVLLVSLAFSKVELPEISTRTSAGNNDKIISVFTILKNRCFLFGFLALLAYEVSEICINSYFINFTTGQGWLSDTSACKMLSISLALFMLGRFAGCWFLRKYHPQSLLLLCTVGCLISMIIVLMNWGEISLWALMANYSFEAIMFPTIYSLSLQGLSKVEVKRAGSILMMSPVGGCAFLLMGFLADRINLVIPFVLPLCGFLVIFVYALWLRRKCH